MNYETYSNLVGKHAMFSPSSTNLLDKDNQYIVGRENLFRKLEQLCMTLPEPILRTRSN